MEKSLESNKICNAKRVQIFAGFCQFSNSRTSRRHHVTPCTRPYSLPGRGFQALGLLAEAAAAAAAAAATAAGH